MVSAPEKREQLASHERFPNTLSECLRPASFPPCAGGAQNSAGADLLVRTAAQLGPLQRPDTILRWNHDLLARRHAAASRPKRPGRPRTIRSIRVLVLRLAAENPSWATACIHGELLVLGVGVAASTVWQILTDADIDPAPERACSTWVQFLRSQADALLALHPSRL